MDHSPDILIPSPDGQPPDEKRDDGRICYNVFVTLSSLS